MEYESPKKRKVIFRDFKCEHGKDGMYHTIFGCEI